LNFSRKAAKRAKVRPKKYLKFLCGLAFLRETLFVFDNYFKHYSKEVLTMKFAIPLAEGKLTAHFGHCQEFALVDVEDNKIKNTKKMVPPPHEPGLLPRWLHEQETNVIIAGGMGARALELFAQNGIKVLTGAPSLTPEELVLQYLDSTLKTGFNMCDH